MGKVIIHFPKQSSVIRIVVCFGLFVLAIFPSMWGQDSLAAEVDFNSLLEDFEGGFVGVSGYGNVPSGWEPSGSQNVEFSKGLDAHHGESCLHAHVTYDPNYYSVLNRNFSFQPDESLNLRIQVKASTTGERAQMKFDASYEWPPGTWNYQSTTHYFYPSSSDWRTITLEGIEVPPNGELSIRLMVHHDFYSGSTDFDLDCLSLSKIGDITGDGNVGLDDAVLALQLLSLMEPSSIVYKTADVNGDGSIGLEEVIYIMQRISGLR